jgi:threonine/homoserine efflux transporter RhtA
MQTLFEESWKDGAYYQEQWMQCYALRKNVWHQLLLALLPFVGAMILLAFLPQQWQTSFLSRILAILSFAAWIVYVIRFLQSVGKSNPGTALDVGNLFSTERVFAILLLVIASIAGSTDLSDLSLRHRTIVFRHFPDTGSDHF